MRAAALLLLLAACGPSNTEPSPERVHLDAMSRRVVSDGEVTTQEASDLAVALQLWVASEERRAEEHADRERRGWVSDAAWFVGAVLSSLLGVNIYRNRSLPGANRIPHP